MKGKGTEEAGEDWYADGSLHKTPFVVFVIMIVIIIITIPGLKCSTKLNPFG